MCNKETEMEQMENEGTNVRTNEHYNLGPRPNKVQFTLVQSTEQTITLYTDNDDTVKCKRQPQGIRQQRR